MFKYKLQISIILNLSWLSDSEIIYSNYSSEIQEEAFLIIEYCTYSGLLGITKIN